MITYKEIRFFTIFLFVFLSYNNYPEIEEDVVGRYISVDEDNQIEYMSFFKNKTYKHYKLDQDTLVKALGIWQLSFKQGALFLTNWADFSLANKIHRKNHFTLITINNGRIFFSADDYKRNFKKIEEKNKYVVQDCYED